MAKPKSMVPITAQDLKKLSLEQTDCCNERKRLQKFLDDTHTGVDIDSVSEKELEQIRAAVDNPTVAFLGPNILIWNNICRQRSEISQRPR